MSRWAIQRFMCLVVGLFVRVLFALRAVNPPRLEGAYLLAPNHTSFLDPMMVQMSLPRHVTFLMDGAIYENPVLGWFFRFWRAIPVPAGRVPADALKTALAATSRGQVVGIFPEGAISRDGRLKKGRAGVAMLMQRAGVPVVPVAILGTYGVLPRRATFFRPGRILVVFGEPIEPIAETSGRQAGKELTERVMAEIAALMERHRPRL